MARNKHRSATAENWVSYPRTMLESPAFRVLGHTAIRVMHRIEIEHMSHGGAENGKLGVTYDQFAEYGISRNAVAPAIRELVALGFLEITEKGIASSENGRPNRFRLTHVNSKHRVQPTDEWRRVATLEEADQLAKEARAEKDRRACDLGSRGARARLKKQNSVTRPDTDSVSTTATETPILSH
jgi:DNA-binding transcriptional MocR family regulator